MKDYLKYPLGIGLLLIKLCASAQTTLYDTTAKPILISKQFSFTEGASVDKKGNVFFTDQPNNKIWEYDTDGKSLYSWIARAVPTGCILIVKAIS